MFRHALPGWDPLRFGEQARRAVWQRVVSRDKQWRNRAKDGRNQDSSVTTIYRQARPSGDGAGAHRGGQPVIAVRIR